MPRLAPKPVVKPSSSATPIAPTEDLSGKESPRRPRQSAVAPTPISTLETQLERSVADAQRKHLEQLETMVMAHELMTSGATLYTRECPQCNARMVSAVPTANAVCEVCGVLTRSVLTPGESEALVQPQAPSWDYCPSCGHAKYFGEPCENPKCQGCESLGITTPDVAAQSSKALEDCKDSPDALPLTWVSSVNLIAQENEAVRGIMGKALSIQTHSIPTTPTRTTTLRPTSPAPELPPVLEIFGHRSGAETHMQCPRRYFLNYAYLDTGITQDPKPIYFATGSAVHIGLENILNGNGIDAAIEATVRYLHRSSAYAAIELDSIKLEQTLLVTGLVQSFWTYAWPSMRANYEFLHVEHSIVEPIYATASDGVTQMKINMMSKPDFIARVRLTGEIVCGSWKTIDDPIQMRKTLFANDLQGLTEMHWGELLLQQIAADNPPEITTEEIRHHLEAVLADLQNATPTELIAAMETAMDDAKQRAVAARVSNAPTKIDYVQMIYLVKGNRVLVDVGDDPNRAALEDEYSYDPAKVYKQATPLCYQYVNTHPEHRVSAKSEEIAEYSWSYRYWKPGNVSYNNLGKDWLSRPLESIEEQRGWIEALNTGEVFPSTLGDERNEGNPLSKIIVFDTPLYRNSDRARRFSDQQRTRFIDIANKLWELKQWAPEHSGAAHLMAKGNGIYNNPIAIGLSQLIDELFPQSLTACRAPYRCAYLPICDAPQPQHEVLDFVTVPEGFKLRWAHHKAEQEFQKKEGKVDEGAE